MQINNVFYLGCVMTAISMIHLIDFIYLQAYHSQITQVNDHLANFALLPLRTQVRGPAPTTNAEDIIDESIYYFKANIFFRTYEIKVNSKIILLLFIKSYQIQFSYSLESIVY